MPKVKFYRDMPADNPNVLLGISGDLPAVIIPDGVDAPDETYVTLNDLELLQYNTSKQTEYEMWYVINNMKSVVLVD